MVLEVGPRADGPPDRRQKGEHAMSADSVQGSWLSLVGGKQFRAELWPNLVPELRVEVNRPPGGWEVRKKRRNEERKKQK